MSLTKELLAAMDKQPPPAPGAAAAAAAASAATGAGGVPYDGPTRSLGANSFPPPVNEEDGEGGYYHYLMTRIDEALLGEETKQEQLRRESEVEIRRIPPGLGGGGGEEEGGYVLSFFLAGVTPLQALTYMSDPECYQFFAHPRVTEVEVLAEAREGDGDGAAGLLPGMEVLEAALTMQGRGPLGVCCLPVKRRIEVKFCVERGRRRLTCHERLQGYEKTHTYTYEEDAHGVWVTDVVSVKPPPSSALSCLTRPFTACCALSWERAFPLSQVNHVRSMERLKRIMEHDELEGYATDSSVGSLLFTDL